MVQCNEVINHKNNKRERWKKNEIKQLFIEQKRILKPEDADTKDLDEVKEKGKN